MLTLLFAAALASAPVHQGARAPALTNAEDCLRANVAAAVGSNASAIDSADFLLTYLCAGPVGTAARYEFNTELLAGVKGMSAGWPSVTGLPPAAAEDTTEGEIATGEELPDFNPFSGVESAQVDPVTGEIVLSEDTASSVMVNALRSQSTSYAQLVGAPKPVFLRELAGRLVLEAQRR